MRGFYRGDWRGLWKTYEESGGLVVVVVALCVCWVETSDVVVVGGKGVFVN